MILGSSLNYRRCNRQNISDSDGNRSRNISPYLSVSARINKSLHSACFDYLPTLYPILAGIQAIGHLYLDNDRWFIDSWSYLDRQRNQVLVHASQLATRRAQSHAYRMNLAAWQASWYALATRIDARAARRSNCSSEAGKGAFS
jgi:hypothetical protein